MTTLVELNKNKKAYSSPVS